MNKNWDVLLDKDIIGLMIGDSDVTVDMFYEYKMPYMSGPDICSFGETLGFHQDYCNSNKLSRCNYMENVLKYVIKDSKVNLFFKELLKLKRFRNVENAGYYGSAQALYWQMASGLMEGINQILFYDKCHVEYNFETWQFSLVDDEKDIKITSERIEKIDRQYIKRLKSEIDNTIKNGDYESTITKSRTLLEEIMKYGIEKKNKDVEVKGDITKLYREFKTLYNMHQSSNIDNRINDLLSGFEKIITSISSMRDENSDSHGAGNKRTEIEEHHVILFSNASLTMSEFLLSVVEGEKISPLN